MAQLFSPRADTTFSTALFAAVVSFVAIPLAAWAFARTPAATGQYRTYRQPVPFAHSLHVTGLKIECRYCHAGAEHAAMAGLPPTAACVPCHHDATVSSNLFTAVRQSLSSGTPLPWRRVTRVADRVLQSRRARAERRRLSVMPRMLPQTRETLTEHVQWATRRVDQGA